MTFLVHFERPHRVGDEVTLDSGRTVDDLKEQYFNERGLAKGRNYDALTFDSRMRRVQLPGAKRLSELNPKTDVVVLVRPVVKPFPLEVAMDGSKYPLWVHGTTTCKRLIQQIGRVPPDYRVYVEGDSKPLPPTAVVSEGQHLVVSRPAQFEGATILEARHFSYGIVGIVRFPGNKICRWTELNGPEAERWAPQTKLLDFPSIVHYETYYNVDTKVFGVYALDLPALNCQRMMGWPLEKAHIVMIGIAKALEHLHANRMVHGHLGLEYVLMNFNTSRLKC
jgi:hypothetical protein